MELEPSSGFQPALDRRPPVPVPPPVKLVTVDDATLPASAGMEEGLDAFYVTLLQFERDPKAGGLVYRAENFRLRFEIFDGPIARDHLRPLGIEVPSLGATEAQLIDLQYPCTRMRSLTPGLDKLALLDPAGNWIDLVEAPRIL